MSMLINPHRHKVPPSVVFTDSDSSASNGTSFNFTVDIGTAPASGRTRHIVIYAAGIDNADGNDTINAVTINSVAATSVVAQRNLNNYSSIWIAEVPTGATGVTLAITTSGEFANLGAVIWAVYDLVSATATDTANSTADPAVLDMDVLAGDIAIGGGITFATGGVTWTGLTEDADIIVEGAVTLSGASLVAAAAATPATYRVDYATASSAVGVGAVFR